MSGTNPPLNENFEFLKMMIFNLIFLWKIWKYFSEFFKVHIKGGLNYKIMRAACARAHMRAHACTRIFQLMTPLHMYLKKLRKIFPNFPQKNKIENHHFKKLKIFI